MSYYDPLYAFSSQSPYEPLYAHTKNQIERSILNLEDKLRRRRQLDYQIATIDIVNPNPIRVDPLPIYPPELLREEQLRVNEIIARDKLRQTIQQEAIQHQYALRVQKLRREKELLHRNILIDSRPSEIQSNSYRAHEFNRANYDRDNEYNKEAIQNRSPYHPKADFISYDHDDELVKKYQDGTRAKEYLNDLDHQLKRRGNPEEREGLYSDRRTSERKYEEKSNLKQSPYDRIKYQSEVKNHPTSSKHKEEQEKGQYKNNAEINKKNEFVHRKKEEVNPVQQNLQQKFNKVQKREYEQSTNQKTPKTLQIIKQFRKSPSPLSARAQKQDKSAYRLNRVYSTSKKLTNKERVSRSKSKHELKYSKLEHGRSQVAGFEANALKKIENRLKLSQIIYEDSQFRNVKHELVHLFNTYENQIKIRKEVKDKINNNPLILRKHAMVVE